MKKLTLKLFLHSCSLLLLAFILIGQGTVEGNGNTAPAFDGSVGSTASTLLPVEEFIQGTVKTSIQQTWIDSAQTGILEIISRHDMFQGPLTPEQMTALRQLNPDILLFPFDSMLDNGNIAKPAGSGETPSELWLADPADYGNSSRVWWDVGDECNAVNGECYRDWKARQAVRNARDRGYDGIYLDLWQVPWGGLFPKPRMTQEEYIDGMTDFGDLLRQEWPEGIFLANGARALTFSQSINGYMWEDFPTFAWPETAAKILDAEAAWLANTQGNSTSRIGPSIITVNIRARDYDQYDARFWQSMRYATGLSLLGDNLHVMFNSGNGGSPHWANAYWFDEWSADLGVPLGPADTLPGGVWYREYSKGLVLVNDNDSEKTITAQLLQTNLPDYDGPYYRFAGGQVPEFNDGSELGDDLNSQITLGVFYRSDDGNSDRIGDAVILLKTPETIVSPIYLDDTNCRGPNNIQGEFETRGMQTFTQEGMTSFCKNHFSPFPNSWRYFPRDTAHFAAPGNGEISSRWNLRIGRPGLYEVFAWSPNEVKSSFTDRGGFRAEDIATDAPFTIHHRNGSTTTRVNIRQDGGGWASLGTFAFDPGNSDYIELSNDANGYVLADAVKLVWRGVGEPPIFSDVPPTHWARAYIELLYKNGYIAGCNDDPLMYCPEATMTRAESAVFVERGVHGAGYLPDPPQLSAFNDVPLWEWFAKWANGLWEDGYSAGCGTDPLIYCPMQEHTRTEGSVFFLRMMHGADYLPPDPSGLFVDVPPDFWGAKWIEASYNAGLIPACETSPQLRFCPDDPLDRAMAAYMMVQAKGLSIP
jgi:hypothetical protein